MRIAITLGGNALLRRSNPMTTGVQRRNIKVAAEAIAPLAAADSIVIAHGNGPQVRLLSLQAEAYEGADPYPLDMLDAGTQGMIGYLIQEERRGSAATILGGDMVTTQYSAESLAWYAVSAKDAARQMGVDLDDGLNQGEALSLSASTVAAGKLIRLSPAAKDQPLAKRGADGRPTVQVST